MLVHRLECVVQFHVGVERVVLRPGRLVGVGIVERCRHLGFVGEELAEFKLSGDGVVLHIVLGACCDAVLQSSESLGGVSTGDVDGAEVRELHIEVALCSPSTFVVVFLETEFVDPHLSRLDLSCEVPHSDDHGFHLS